MDPLIADYLDHIEESHAAASYVSDMGALANAFGIRFGIGAVSIATPDGEVVVRRSGDRRQRRADAAHEIVHQLSDLGQYTEAIHYHHASVPDMHAHIEALTDHGADLLLMPTLLVREVIGEYGDTARAVWELSQAADVSPELALRRMAFLTLDQRRAGFLATGSYITYSSANCYSPFWPGGRLPEPHIALEGVSLFRLPSRRNQTIGFLACE
ncbi:hypothetical protein WDJ50_18480 (plasmid) [Deinococcus sp. VB142]|uniref:IrrE N-terminal-like domain-containing protein n=1 Tax=Deinococcus sp. VB142 TaxID=3112952 RepID=A0AAU6Q8T9_9DEIO